MNDALIRDMKVSLSIISNLPLVATHPQDVRRCSPSLVHMKFLKRVNLPEGESLILTDAGKIALH